MGSVVVAVVKLALQEVVAASATRWEVVVQQVVAVAPSVIGTEDALSLYSLPPVSVGIEIQGLKPEPP